MRIIIFRHLPDDGYESAFEVVANLRGMIVKPMVLPGLGVAKDIYIRHHNFWHQGETMLLITYTNEEIRNEEVEIVMGERPRRKSGQTPRRHKGAIPPLSPLVKLGRC